MTTAKISHKTTILYLKGYKRCKNCGDHGGLLIKTDRAFCECCGTKLGYTPASKQGTLTLNALRAKAQ